MKPALLITLTFFLSLSGMAKADEDTIRIGYFNWSDAMFTANVVNYILTRKMDREVDMIKADPAAIFQGVASGDLDFHTDAWLPDTHADYYAKVAKDTLNVGPIYADGRLGWVVPDYIPEDQLDSIEDLKSAAVKDKLNGRIIGIDPGAGLTRLSKKAMQAYGLEDYGYNLQISSGAGMTAALKRAIQRQEWIVVTGWSPHWKFGRWELRYLDDPKGVLGGIERADILVRKGFYRDEPAIYALLDRMTIPLDDVQKGMYNGEESSYPQAAKEYVEAHPKLVRYWITGELAE